MTAPAQVPATRRITSENIERVLTFSIGIFALVLMAFAIPDLMLGPQLPGTGRYWFFLCIIPIMILGAMVMHRSKAITSVLAGTSATLILVSFIMWQYGLLGAQNTVEPRPWSLGIAGPAIGLAALAWDSRNTRLYGLVFAFAIWLMPLMPFGNTRTLSHSWQDALLTVVMTIAIVAAVAALRKAAANSDATAEVAGVTFAKLAQWEALAAERSHLDSLTHDTILSTLIVASQATQPESSEAAQRAAGVALTELDALPRRFSPQAPNEVTPADLLAQLRSGSLVYGAHITEPKNLHKIPLRIHAQLSQAFIGATLEAVRNSAIHDGVTVPRIQLSFDGDGQNRSYVRIEISDSGPGFDVDSLPSDRMGIRLSIMRRMQEVGGCAEIESTPGTGTTVRLTWSQGMDSRG